MIRCQVDFVTILRVVCVAVVLSATAAYADDYRDVNALARAGKLSEALVKADQYLAGKPRDPEMRFIKGLIQTQTGKIADAISTFTQLTQDYPELAEPYNNLAVLYANQSQFDKARDALEIATRTSPGYSTAHENLGDIYARLASQAYSKALQLGSANAGIQPKLTQLQTLFALESRGQKPNANPQSSGPVTAASLGKEPVAVPTAVVTGPGPAASSDVEKDVEAAVRTWATAWASKDMTGYLNSYGKEFVPPGSMSRKSWEDDRRSHIVGKSSISVKVIDLEVSVKGDKAMAIFVQAYSAGSLNTVSRKTLELLKTGDRWMIVRESSG